MLYDDEEPIAELLMGDVRANFLMMMQQITKQWNDRITADVFRNQGG
jgi:hypothetical protein